MPSPAVLTALQWSITVSGCVAFWLACISWGAAWQERDALRRTGVNGALAAAARLHLITSTSRLVAASCSIVGGLSLLMLPDFALPAGVVAGCCWLVYNLLMTVNLSAECWARRKMDKETP